MDWKNLPSGGNIDDRRGGGGRVALGGGLGLVIAIVAALFGFDPSAVLGGLSSNVPTQQSTTRGAPAHNSAQNPAQRDEEYDFVDRILASTDQVWTQIFSQSGRRYNKPTLTLFRDSVNGACGYASSAMGPFYCPLDSRVYLDTGFFNVMRERLGGGGTFAYSYVIAHEVGHHVQNELGITEKVQRLQRRVSKTQSNQLSVRLELQADCFAGVWGHHVKDLVNLSRNDLQQAINTAEAIGDDALQHKSKGHVVPDSFTHGSSQQRVEWFLKGFESGSANVCNTF